MINNRCNTCGLITYHSAYNYGSALQAYATQQALHRIGIEAEIINYRMSEQKYFYETFFRTKYGMKTLVNDLTFIPVCRKKAQRKHSFEKFFTEHLSLTQEHTEPEEVSAIWTKYDTIISGSDQIWNKDSCELSHNDWRYMDPYLLKGYEGRKISYASSINTMEGENLKRILPEINSFFALSFREGSSAEKISQLLHKEVCHVLDPTFLLNKEDWIEQLNLKKNENREPYILCYSLAGVRPVAKLLHAIKAITKQRKCKAIVVTPFTYIPPFSSAIEYHPEYGPLEFLEALYNAEAVITDSYHGAALSINFEKEFYSLTKHGKSDVRKNDLLNRLGLQERIIHDAATIPELDLPPIDFTAVYGKLADMRQHSMDYLISSLSGTSWQ